jgi:hypothetical protein
MVCSKVSDDFHKEHDPMDDTAKRAPLAAIKGLLTELKAHQEQVLGAKRYAELLARLRRPGSDR